jgi:hypothetical protein
MMPLTGGSGDTLLILLVAGHLVGDFALQSERMAAGKRQGRHLVPHVVLIAFAHLVLLAPLLSWSLVLVVAGLALSHGFIDMVKAQGRWRSTAALRVFLVDQGAHIAMVFLAWMLVVHWIGVPEPRLAASELGTFLAVGIVAGAFAFNASGGAVIVSGVLALRERDLEAGEGASGSGRMIGILERTLSLILILLGQWAAIGILVAAKSIARFDELKDRRFSEYYLIGTLTSLLVAVLTGLGLMAVLGTARL